MNPFAIGGAGVAVAGLLYIFMLRADVAEIQSDYDAHLKLDAEAAVTALQEKDRVESDNRDSLADIGKKLEDKQNEVVDLDGTVADLAKRLRIESNRTHTCPELPETPTTPAVSDGGTSSDFLTETSRFLTELIKECDDVAEQLASAQDVIRADRQ